MSDCAIWTGGTSMGYGEISQYPRLPIRAHKWAYLTFVGPVPKGHHVHHLCGQKLCINPDHLEALSNAEHRHRHRKATCVHGHALTQENIYVRPDNGKRQCKECGRLRANARHHRIHPEAPYYPARGPRR